MVPLKFDNQGYGKDNKWVTYNSTFRDGVRVGHIYSIAQSMNVHVIPNHNRGLVVGLGFPDRRKDFPEYDRKLAMQDSDYQQVYENMIPRLAKLSDRMTFFRRLYEVDKAMRGRLPMLRPTEDIIGSDEVGFSPIPFGMTMVVPKWSHVIYPHKFDQCFVVDYSGQFEPRTGDIANQYVFIPKMSDSQDGWVTGRLRQKLAGRRNIQVTAVHEDTVPEKVRCEKDTPLLSPGLKVGFEGEYDDKVFEVALLPNTEMDSGQMHLIHETLDAAARNRREAVFAIPYRQMPQTREDYGSPFRRALAVRDHINGQFESSSGISMLDDVHITYVEREDDRKFTLNDSTANFFPSRFVLHKYEQMVADIPAMSEVNIHKLGLKHLAAFG